MPFLGRLGIKQEKHMEEAELKYFREYRKNNPEKLKEIEKRYCDKHREKFRSRTRRSVNECNNGKDGEIMKENGQCAICGSVYKLVIHHKDHKGHNLPRRERNNDIENLEVLCNSCHSRLHTSQRWSVLKNDVKSLVNIHKEKPNS